MPQPWDVKKTKPNTNTSPRKQYSQDLPSWKHLNTKEWWLWREHRFSGYKDARIHEFNQHKMHIALGRVSCEGLFQSILMVRRVKSNSWVFPAFCPLDRPVHVLQLLIAGSDTISNRKQPWNRLYIQTPLSFGMVRTLPKPELKWAAFSPCCIQIPKKF